MHNDRNISNCSKRLDGSILDSGCITMTYCMCNEDFEQCNCKEHICHAHGNGINIERPED